MKFLLLNGHGIDVRVSGAKLHVKDGRYSTTEDPEEYVFSPKRMDIDSVIIYGRKGNLTLDAIRWLIKHNVQISILNWDGKLLTTMLPPESTNVKTRFAQYHAFEDEKARIKIAKNFIEAKFDKTQVVLDYLKQRYPEIEYDFSPDLKKLDSAKKINDILGVEGGVAYKYWNEFSKVIPEKYDYESRVDQSRRATGAGDMVNTMLNYGYALLEAECLRTINAVGLDSHVGFLHEMNTGKNSLAYDLQEPFRFLVDFAVISLIESERMENKDFIRTENYSLRLRPSGAKKLTEEVNLWFNKRISYKGNMTMWSYVMFLKTRELAQYLTDKRKDIDFVVPQYETKRQDTSDIRKKILSISYSDWKKLGFSKGTLHYMKKNANADKPFTLNTHNKERLDKWEKLVANG
ncbi:CRISPR-associated protein, Cas1 family [Methanolobus tindarius DSM 2278]|uniref:CRISPR-associated endonuclease Cas1 n=1 Tax=Methanolobus tindarius DSM 2278 TaxID=1090322 RepID=W9DUT1_METTI|nr:CRISPR-associated endonuclease Cas1 [Methanolobus tindarius]ETA69400.1 CRISPR-associated protein, Cas1 family [Methanolobus tindarius DSM 2278]